MPTPTPDYRRLTPKKRSLAGYSQLWMGPDHLLLVNSVRFTESYQRFRLTDIQAISVTDGPNLFVMQVVLGLAAIAWGMLALTVTLPFGKWFFGITGALFLLLVMIDVARGPRCRCLLYTAVSQQRLAPVSRQSIAKAFLETVSPAIEAVQGSFSPQDIREGEVQPAPPAPPEIFGDRLRTAAVLFGLCLLDAALFSIVYKVPRAGLSIVLPTAIVGELCLAVAALIQGRSRPTHPAFLLVLITGGLAVWDLVTIGRVFWEAALRGVMQGPTPPDFNAILTPSAKAIVFATAWRLLAGGLGLLALFAMRGRKSSA